MRKAKYLAIKKKTQARDFEKNLEFLFKTKVAKTPNNRLFYSEMGMKMKIFDPKPTPSHGN